MNHTFNWKIITVHCLVWISYLFLLILFNSEYRSFGIAISRSITSICIQALVFYLNLYILLPKLFEKKKYLLYALSMVVLIFLTVWSYDEITYNMLPDEVKTSIEKREMDSRFFTDENNNIRQYIKRGDKPSGLFHRKYLYGGFLVFISLLISTIYYNTVTGKKKEKEFIHIKNQMLEAESRMLKWQINPHFLFNTLNNIYSMSQLESKKTPEAIHKLSQMLRYGIYECNDKFVKLDKEIEYIRSYINLQLLKEDDMKNVKFKLSNDNSRLTIAPMLLISFIENGFKHSNIVDTQNSWIKIGLTTKGKQLNFKMENNIPKRKVVDKTGGVGIENVKQRLKLLYPNKHYLNLIDNDGVYSVELMIDLNED